MTGLHDKRRTSESRRSKLLVRSRPDAAAAAAAPPPARRTMRAEVQLPSRKREHSVPPARVARSPRLPRGEQDTEDVAPAPPPPKPSRDWDPMDVTLAPPPAPRAAEAPARTAYALRNRHVPGTSNRHAPDTSNRKPYIPARKEKRDELKHDRPCSSRKKLEQHEPWEAPSCARVGLEHYNSMNQGDEHELVKAVGVHPFTLCGLWLHANFLARPKGASNCFDLVPKWFFAELKLDGFGLHCASCVMIDSVESDNLGACGMCPSKIKHPADGVYRGGQTHWQLAAAGGYHGGQTRLEPDDDGDLDEAFSF